MRVKNLALVALITTFVLIIWGAVVHNTESSLACPDWPLCYNKFFPNMEGSILIEHGHRLLATLVGILSIGIVGFSFVDRKKSESHNRLFNLSCFSLFLVIAQGALGGITVIYFVIYLDTSCCVAYYKSANSFPNVIGFFFPVS